MQYEQEKIHRDNLAEIWRDAEHRRSYELFTWLKEFFRERQLKVRAEPSYSSRRPSLIR